MDSQFPDKMEESTCINELASHQVQLLSQTTQDHVKPFSQMDPYIMQCWQILLTELSFSSLFYNKTNCTVGASPTVFPLSKKKKSLM
jgi:hypothetical protein